MKTTISNTAPQNTAHRNWRLAASPGAGSSGERAYAHDQLLVNNHQPKGIVMGYRIDRRMPVVFLLFMFLWMGSASALAAETQTPPWGTGPFKVLLEVNSQRPEIWQRTIGTINQIAHIVGLKKAKVEVIAWGPGLKMLLKPSPVAMNIETLSMQGVEFAACHQTMMALHIPASDLATGVTVVPGAIAEIVKRDHEGWTQIKM